MGFTESRLRRVIKANIERQMSLFLASGAVVSGKVLGADLESDGFISIFMEMADGSRHFECPCDSIIGFASEVLD